MSQVADLQLLLVEAQTMQDFRRLKVWQKSHGLALEYFSILFADLGLLKRDDAMTIGADAAEIKRMLCGLIASLSPNTTKLITDS